MPSKYIQLSESNLNIAIEIADDGDVRLSHFSALPFDETVPLSESERAANRLIQLQATGYNPDAHHGEKHVATQPGSSLRYVTHRIEASVHGTKLEIDLAYDGIEATVHFQLFNGIAVVRAWTAVRNMSTAPLGLEYLSSFTLGGIARAGTAKTGRTWGPDHYLHVGNSMWLGEAQWRCHSLPDLGLYDVGMGSLKRLSYSQTGTWPCDNYLPMGIFEDRTADTFLFWQLESSGSWQWEIGDIVNGNNPTDLYVSLSGPTEAENHWWKELQPGESFESVPVAVGSVHGGGVDSVFGELTRYRRAIRRPNDDNEALPVIFNDFMNCLEGDPTTQKLLPLIDAAAEVGCEYFVVDAGWYGDGFWWTEVGEWLPSEARFPGGIKEVLDRIRERDMIAGLWLELEVMGINCPLVGVVPDDWFFQRHARKVIDHGRYQLDYRNPAVIAHADSVVKRLVEEYGAGYIKMDYNINAGLGTETNADSAGDGLLQHNRAYLEWLDATFARYPDLVIENCGSGGMRMTYSFLARHSIQSTSDQTDYRKYAKIAASCFTAVTPEQSAIWSYPLRDADREAVIFNMTNALLQRVHQSGHMAEISPEVKALVREGLDTYKTIRQDIKTALPFWPLGLPNGELLAGWASVGLKAGAKTYLAVWRLGNSPQTIQLPIAHLASTKTVAKVLYPAHDTACNLVWDSLSGELTVTLPDEFTARGIVIE